MAALPPYPYTPLPPQCIRVLSLQPGQSDAPLECEFVIQQVDGQPYEALSYVWGDPVSPLLILLFSCGILEVALRYHGIGNS